MYNSLFAARLDVPLGLFLLTRTLEPSDGLVDLQTEPIKAPVPSFGLMTGRHSGSFNQRPNPVLTFRRLAVQSTRGRNW
jgi:hypothetical protein